MNNYNSELNEFVRRLAQTAYDESRRVCPVKTGRLKRSITLNNFHNRKNGNQFAVINTTVPYAANVEFGGYRRRPKPFLAQGAEAARRCAAALLKAALSGGSK